MLAQGLQYAPSKGIPSFLAQLTSIRQTYHGTSSLESEIDTCVSVGSQNGLEMLLASIISPGDGILVDDPIYPGTKAILRPIGANIIGKVFFNTIFLQKNFPKNQKFEKNFVLKNFKNSK